MRKNKRFIIGIVTIIIILIIFSILFFRDNNGKIQWIKDLSYDVSHVYDISFPLFSPCPTIPVKIGGKEVELLFDSGNGMGISITTALENSDQMVADEIGFQDDFEYPLQLALNSDILKANNFVITIDKIQNNIIFFQN